MNSQHAIIESRAIHLPQTDIDTDQIIPGRFLTTVSDSGFGEMAFADWRFSSTGQRREGTPFDALRDGDISILVAGHNFGCGSSREHAVWALRDLGIHVVISSRIADIFTSNALKNGLAPIVVSREFYQHLTEHPTDLITIDLQALQLNSAGRTERFSLDAFSQRMLVEGRDQLDHLLSYEPAISDYESRGGATPWTR
ncbi:MAG: 3-isopropylmalate dehydratase small subunit [Pirellulales bacterium]|nr:3-isopropylmalate dehydratase small subunit [Pirellulales bacterium]